MIITRIKVRIRAHIRANRVSYIMTAVAISAIAHQQGSRIRFNRFLVSRGINLNEYYIPEDCYRKLPYEIRAGLAQVDPSMNPPQPE
jgi:hypothetical protein